MLDTLSVGDRADLLEVYARSVMLLDLGQCEAWADLFDSHAVVRYAREDSTASQLSGRQVLLQLARDTLGGRSNLTLGPSNPPIRRHHILRNVRLYTDRAHYARGYAHLHITTRGGNDAPRWPAAGIYSDRLSKCGSGCWRFQSRTLNLRTGTVAGMGSMTPSLRRTA